MRAQGLVFAAQTGTHRKDLVDLAFEVIEGNAHGRKFPAKM